MAERNDLTRSQERSAEAIRQDIAARRESISDTVDRLGTRIQEKLDWRQWVTQYPYVAIGTAAGLGILLSGIFKPRRSPTDRIRDAVGEMVEDFFEDIKGSIGDVAVQAVRPAIMKASLGIAVGKAVIDLIRKKANEAPAVESDGELGGQDDFVHRRGEDF
jgi:ElaB/YqjD/DUF883 family membrane-anchored ribosome-binding protein